VCLLIHSNYTELQLSTNKCGLRDFSIVLNVVALCLGSAVNL
jgi:uncharacterized membrane protein